LPFSFAHVEDDKIKKIRKLFIHLKLLKSRFLLAYLLPTTLSRLNPGGREEKIHKTFFSTSSLIRFLIPTRTFHLLKVRVRRSFGNDFDEYMAIEMRTIMLKIL